MSKVALIRFGYQDYAVPVEDISETLSKFAAMKKVESRYETGGYVYWYKDDGKEDDFSVTVVSSERIHAADPGKTPATIPAPKAAPAPDDRLIAAPSDPNPISIESVPATRGFVDEYRDCENS